MKTPEPQVITTYPSSVTLRDPELPHQIVIATLPDSSHQIYVSCNCLLGPKPPHGAGRYEPLEVRTRWEAADALAVWRAHMTEVAA